MRPILDTLACLNTRQTNDVPKTSLQQTLETYNLFPISPGQQKTILWGGIGATTIVLILIAGNLATYYTIQRLRRYWPTFHNLCHHRYTTTNTREEEVELNNLSPKRSIFTSAPPAEQPMVHPEQDVPHRHQERALCFVPFNENPMHPPPYY
jgi:hypothetical protein